TTATTHYKCIFFSSRRRHTIFKCDWSSDVCSSDLRCSRPGFPGSQVVNIGRAKASGNEFAANLHVLDGRRIGWTIGTQLANNGRSEERRVGKEGRSRW